MKNVLITGASRGLGLMTASKFQTAGWRVYGTSTTEQGLQSFLVNCPGAYGSVVKIGAKNCEQQVKDAVKDMVELYGDIDLLINNIGIRCREPISDISLKRFNQVMTANVGSAFLFTKEVVPVMKAQGQGRIMYINSLAGLQPYGGFSVYAASKYAMTGFGKSMQHELHSSNIQVINLYPGGIQTDFHDTPRPEFMHAYEVADVIISAAQQPWNAYLPEIIMAPARDTRIP
jgi:NAD(P)-dependent dehydrogenase (short-subunit alcohol dehydrogenase family)